MGEATKTRLQNILRLYRAMPGAPVILSDEAQDNDHWRFCAAIVDQMTIIAMAYSR